MGYWNWINGVYTFDEAVVKIDDLNQETTDLRKQLREANKIILSLMEQHIKRGPDLEWRLTYFSSDEDAVEYEKKYQLRANESLGDICE